MTLDAGSALWASAIQTLQRWSASDSDQEQLRAELLAYVTAHDDALSRACRPDHLTASALVIDQDREHVLLGLHRKVGLWLQFGGHIEPDDKSLLDAARRETVEESGVAVLDFAPEPLRIDRHAAPCGARHHLDIQFMASASRSEKPTTSSESLAVRWFAIDRLPDATDEAVRTLVAAATRR